MLRPVLHPLFLIPSFLLFILLGTTVAVEYYVGIYREEMEEVLVDRSIALTGDLEATLWKVYRFIDGLADKRLTQDEATVLRGTLVDLRTHMLAVQDYYKGEHVLARLSLDKPSLNAVLYRLILLDEEISSQSKEGGQIPPILRDNLAAMIDSVKLILGDSQRAFYRETGELLGKGLQQEAKRETLDIMILVTVLALIGFLCHSAYIFHKEVQNSKHTLNRNALFAAIMESMRIGVMIRDIQSKGMPIVYVNKAFTEMTGYDLKDTVNKPIGFLAGLHTEEKDINFLQSAFAAHRATTLDMMIYRKDNVPFWSEWHIGPVYDRDKVTHYFSLFTDISSMRDTRESMRLAKEEAERAGAVKSAFLATMSHEIRTPINGILGVLDLLKDTNMSEEQAKYLSVAANSGKHLLQIINDVLDYSKIEAGKLTLENNPFLLSDLLKETFDLMLPTAQAKNLRMESILEPGTPEVLVSDEGRLKQILFNLLSNAIKFTESGAVRLHISSLMNETGELRKSALMRFEVIDTGIGISLTEQENLFSEFTQVERSFTRRFGGTGLGLAITKQLVRLMNGEIGVESRPNQGSKFWFMLPMELSTHEAIGHAVKLNTSITSFQNRQHNSNDEKALLESQSTQDAGGSKGLILLAEDNPVNQLVATRYLHKAGFHVDLAENGAIALDKVKKNVYHAVLMDISMPEMDGLEATRRIRALGSSYARLPIIAVTAHVMRGDRERCIAAGINDYLCKPLHFHSLVQVLGHWIKVENTDTMKESPTAITEEPPLFDSQALQNLERDLDRSTVVRITGVFLKDSEERVRRVLEKIKQGNTREVGKEAHALKSSSAGCGLAEFAELMRNLETAGNKEDLEAIRELGVQVLPLYLRSRDALTEAIKSYLPHDNAQ